VVSAPTPTTTEDVKNSQQAQEFATTEKKSKKKKKAPKQSQPGNPRAGNAENPGNKNQNPNQAAGQNPTQPADTTPSQPLGGGYTLKVVPIEGGTYYRVKGVSNFWSETNLQITKMPNHDVPTVVASNFTDLTASRIQEIAGVMTTIAKTAMAFGAAPECGPLRDFSYQIDSVEQASIQVPDQRCWTLAWAPVVSSPSEDALPVSVIDTKLVQPKSAVSVFPVPACRDIKLTIAPSSSNTTTQNSFNAIVRIADPSYIRLVSLPKAGKIAMHPTCDADITDNPSDPYKAYFDAFGTIANQVATIKGGGKEAAQPQASPSPSGAN